MSSGERLAAAIVLSLVILVGGSTGAAAYAWHRAGNVRVVIHESGPGGTDLSLSVPGLLVNGAIAVFPMPQDAELNARLRELTPVLQAVASRLSTLPDVVFVDVKDRGQTVRVEKLGSELLVRIASAEDRVEIAVPIESVRRLMNRLEA
jgi:hypothetical protein